MLIAKSRQAAISLMVEPPDETDSLRRWARQAAQTATVILTLLLFTAVLGPGFASLGESSELARMGLLVALATVSSSLKTFTRP